MSTSRPPQPDYTAINTALGVHADVDDDFVILDTPVDKHLQEDDFYEVDVSKSPSDDEIQALLPHAQQPPSLGAQTLSIAQRAAMSARNSALYVARRPVTTIIAVITAAPSAINSLVAPTHERPNVISLEWWNSLLMPQQAHATINFVSSLGLNTLVNMVFLPQAATEFMKTAPHTFDSPRQFGENTVSLLLAMGAATASGMISYNSFLWLPAAPLTAFFPAGLSFLSALASRYVGVTSVKARVKNLFSDNVTAQKEFIDILAHLDEVTLTRIKAEFDVVKATVAAHKHNADDGVTPSSKPLDNRQFYAITRELASRLDHIIADARERNLEPIRKVTTREQALHCAALFADLSLSLAAVAPASFLTHMQKGYDGVNLIASGKFNDANVWAKRAIGALPGLAPAMLYGVCTLELRTTLWRLAQEVYKKPGSAPFATLLLLANGLSASSMQNVGEGIATDPNNIIGVTDKAGWYASIYVMFTALGGGVVNANPSIKMTLPKEAATLDNITFEQFVRHLSDTNKNTIGDGTTTSLRSLSLFNSSKPRAKMSNPSTAALEAKPVQDPDQSYTYAGGNL